MSDLTPKMEAFALAYVETGVAAEAYRRAYDVKAATLHSTIYSAASRLLADPKISARVLELQEQAADLSLYTVKQAVEEYEVARQLALQVENPTAAATAVTGKVRLFGLDGPKRLEVSGPGGGPIETSITDEALIEQALRLGIAPEALGLSGTEENPD